MVKAAVLDQRHLRSIPEADWQEGVRQHALLRGWLFFHPWSAKHSAAGYPDCTMVRRSRLIFAELKRVGEVPTPEQVVWLEALRGVPGVEVYVWTVADRDEVERVLA